MDTETTVMQKDLDIDTNEIDIPEMTDIEKGSIYFFIEITRYLQELEKLYRIYRYNLNILLGHYELYNDDTLVRKFESKESDYVIINALVINLISSGKTLMESIEGFVKFLNRCLEGYDNKFKEEQISKLYDKSFSYRFLLFLRNYSQHGHLPVSNDFNGSFCFDLNRILFTPHFNFSTLIENEIKTLIEQMHDEYDNYPKLMLTKNIMDFNYAIHKLYVEFLENIEEVFFASVESIDQLLEDKPNFIYNSDNRLNGLVFYKDIVGNIHCFNPNEKPKEMLINFKTEALVHLKKEEEEKKRFDQSIKFK